MILNIQQQFKAIKSIICLNGNIPSQNFFKRHKNLPIIAADGASNTLIKMDIIPTVIVGDFDSFDSLGSLDSIDYAPNVTQLKKFIPKSTEILHIADQNSTDFQKCLLVLAARDLFPCLVYGATGKETDHTLYNLNIMSAQPPNQQIIFHDSAYEEKEKYGMFVTTAMSGKLQIGAKISLFPVVPSVVSSKGLTWELNNKILIPAATSAATSSVRNVVKSTALEITVHSGNVLVMFDL